MIIRGWPPGIVVVGHRQTFVGCTNGCDQIFAAASRFGYMRHSQRFTAYYIVDHNKLVGCKSGHHSGFCRAVTVAEEVVEAVGWVWDGSGRLSSRKLVPTSTH